MPDAAPPRPGRLARLRERGEAARRQVEVLRPETPLVDSAWETWERDAATGGGLLAGAVAFRLFLLVVPLFLLLTAGLGFLEASATATDPPPGAEVRFAEVIAATMADAGGDAARGRWLTLGAGVVTLVLSMRTVLRALRLVHVLAWRLERTPMRRQAVAVLIGVGVLAVVVAVLVASRWIRTELPIGPLIGVVVVGVAWGVVWLGVSCLLPRDPAAPWTALLPGAVAVGASVLLLYLATDLYLADRIARMSDTYGPLGVAVVMLIWLFLLGRGVVASAMLNATLWARRQRGATNYAPVSLTALRAAVRGVAPAPDRADAPLTAVPTDDAPRHP